ncbi:class I SAM-dependent RNA methyltransferase [Persicobacter psychrovividus]|uniref:RNA methyltransferase n=1 Tax=Persicobacter psychrovividus TaxID=387638 RepID=A0ABN6L9I1_9BACT|nr:RNA methyltransferase [Persicobacter psychrovividus]
MSAQKIVIICAPRMSEVVAQEVRDLNLKVDSVERLSVTLYGDFKTAMKLNLHLRCANRVLLEATSFEAHTANDLYKHIRKFDWEMYIPLTGYFTIDSYVHNDTIRDNRFANQKMKDAIADRFMRDFQKRPDSGSDRSRTCLYLHWVENRAQVYFDTTGETIAKHGYRINPWKAPMIESLAAAAILNSKWNKESHFINPMCGSGTLAIEAALIALNIIPGMFRENYGFMHLRQFRKDDFDQLMQEAIANEKDAPSHMRIIASDHDSKALDAARTNAEEAGVDHLIEFVQCDYAEAEVPYGPGVVIMNPEYGERLGEEEELLPVYQGIGDFFKQQCDGKRAYVFTGNIPLGKRIGLRASRRIEMQNGRIDCRLFEYEMYR